MADTFDELGVEWCRDAANLDHPEAMVNRGRLLQDRGEKAEAEQWYRKAAELNDGRAMNNLGGLLEDRGEKAEAEQWYRIAVKRGDTNAVSSLAALLARRGEDAEAEQWYQRAAERGDIRGMVNFAALLARRGEDPEARPDKQSDAGANAGTSRALLLTAAACVLAETRSSVGCRRSRRADCVRSRERSVVELDGYDYSDGYGSRALWLMFIAGLLVGALGVLFVSKLGEDRADSAASSAAPAAPPSTTAPAASHGTRRASTAPVTSPARGTTAGSIGQSVETVRNGDGPFDPGQGSVPADWVRYPSSGRSSSGRWSIATPGWTPQPAGQFLRLRKPGYGYVAVATRPGVGSPRGLVDGLAGAFGAAQPAYRSLGVRSVRFRSRDATDWEFTYRDSGTDLHAMVRGFVIDGTGYLVWFQTTTSQWGQAQGQRNAMLASFRA